MLAERLQLAVAAAALDVGIEEAERSARLQRLHPEGDPRGSTAIGLTSTP